MTTEHEETWLLDLDGVLWLADEPIAGSADAVDRLQTSGRRVAFFTNNSFVTKVGLLEKFARQGYRNIDEDLVFSSSRIGATLAQPGERAFVIGGEGIHEALRDRGVEIIRLEQLEHERVDLVLIGLDPLFDYPKLGGALRAIKAGARLIGTNEDATYPTPLGLLPGGGAILAAVAYAASVEPVVAGKPHQATVDALLAKLGHIDWAVGDRASTDGVLAKRLGARFALVRSGVTAPGGSAGDPHADLDEADLGAIVQRLEP